MKANSSSYDVIVIGSGMGGLATASLLAQVDQRRVLVLERHFKLGGFMHSFRRNEYEWDPGVHYIGEMQPGSMTRRIMDVITRKKLEWYQLSSPFEKIMFPEGTFGIPNDAKSYREALIARFPLEAKRIDRYFRDVKKAQGWVNWWFVSKQYPTWMMAPIMFFGKRLAGMTTGEYLSRFEDPLLRSILAAQWPDYGTQPSESAFGIHATVAADFFNGGYFPIGGGKEITRHAAEAVEALGGQCLVNHDVQSIIVENGRACGVRGIHKNREFEFRAPVIVSNIGAANTYGKLVPGEYCQREREQITRIKPGPSANILFLGLNDDPSKHGFGDSNYWIFKSLDHDISPLYRDGQLDEVSGAYVSFCSLRNPGQTPHTAQIVTFDDEHCWQGYEDKSWKRRGEEYELKKDQFAEKMIDFAEGFLPGLRKLIAYQELSTPLTVKSFTNHPQGMIYGQACDANRLFRDRWQISSSLPRLYLTGSDVGLPGINAAMMAGVMTAGKILGLMSGLGRIMHQAYSN
jgi:phytoene dehydrogenase-like protein